MSGEAAARQAINAHLAGLDRIEKAAKKAADSREKADRKALDAQRAAMAKAEAAAEKLAAAQQKAAEKGLMAAQKAAAAQQRAADKAAADSIKAAERQAAAQRAADKVAKAVQAAADAQIKADARAADATVAASRRKSDAAARDAAQLQAIQDRYIKKDWDSRVRAEAAKEKAAQKANRAAADVASEQVSGMGKVVGAIGGVVAAYATFGTAKMIIGAISDYWRDLNKSIEDSILRTINYKEKLLELAQLKGNAGNATPELQSQLEFRAKTLQTADQAQRFQEGLLNSGQATVKAKFLDQAGMGQLGLRVGAYQAATGADPNALGQMAGAFPQYIGTQNQDADETFRRMANVFQIFQEGASSQSSAIAQFSKNASLSTNKIFRSPEQQAGLQSLFSLSVPDEAGTRVDQFVRATLGGMGRIRGAHIEGGESQMAYLKGLGANNQMDPIEIGKLIAADLGAQERAEAGAGRQFNAYDYLTHKGYTEETRMALMDFSNRVNSGQYARTFEPMSRPEAAPSLDVARSAERKFAGSFLGQSRNVDIARSFADTAQATGPQHYYDQYMRMAFESLRAEPGSGMTDDYKGYRDSPLWQTALGDRARLLIEKQAAKAGVAVSPDFHDTMGGGPINRMMNSQFDRANVFGVVGEQIAAKGVNPFPSMVEMMKESQKQTLILQNIETALGKGVNPPRIPAAPPVFPAQPAPGQRRP